MNRLLVAASVERRNSWEQQPSTLCRDAATPGFMASIHVRILEVSPTTHEPGLHRCNLLLHTSSHAHVRNGHLHANPRGDYALQSPLIVIPA